MAREPASYSMFRRACPTQLEVQTQRSALFWDASPRHRATVRPDLVVRKRATGEVLMIGDTKWKTLGGKPPSDGAAVGTELDGHLSFSPT